MKIDDIELLDYQRYGEALAAMLNDPETDLAITTEELLMADDEVRFITLFYSEDDNGVLYLQYGCSDNDSTKIHIAAQPLEDWQDTLGDLEGMLPLASDAVKAMMVEEVKAMMRVTASSQAIMKNNIAINSGKFLFINDHNEGICYVVYAVKIDRVTQESILKKCRELHRDFTHDRLLPLNLGKDFIHTDEYALIDHEFTQKRYDKLSRKLKRLGFKSVAADVIMTLALEVVGDRVVNHYRHVVN